MWQPVHVQSVARGHPYTEGVNNIDAKKKKTLPINIFRTYVSNKYFGKRILV